MAEYKIISSGPIASIEPKRAGKMDTLLTVVDVSTNRSMLVRISGDKPTEADIQAAIKAEHEKNLTALSRTYKV